MKKLTEAEFDAQGIEHSLAKFLGKEVGLRGEPHDADNMKYGEIKSLGKVLEEICKQLKIRLGKIQFKQEESENSHPKARMKTAISTLEHISKLMLKEEGREPYDYHWMIIAELLSFLDGALEHFENK